MSTHWPPTPFTKPLAEDAAFWQRIAKDPDSGCWNWTGKRDRLGYGKIKRTGDGREILTHRYVYAQIRGPIPLKLELDHLCRVTSCCNPDHLEAVTHRENILRGVGGAAEKAARTHCPRGHEYDEANTYRDRENRRQCRACHREKERARYRRIRDAKKESAA